MEAERSDTVTNAHINIPKAVQPPRHTNLAHSEKQLAKRTEEQKQM